MSSNKGVISKHLQELMKVQIPSAKLVRNPNPDTIKKPPKPISPPKVFIDTELEASVPKVNKSFQRPSEKFILDLNFKLEDPEVLKANIEKFYTGGNRANWIQSISCEARQQSIPLIKEILYTKEKYLQCKNNYKVLIKQYILEKNLEKSASPSKPPFLASSKTPLSGSKHKTCLLKKQKNQFGSKLEEMRCNVVIEINRANTELMRTVFLVFSLVNFLACCKKDLVFTGIEARNQNLEAVCLVRWKEKTLKNVEKGEFLRLLQESMNCWRMNRVFLAFVDFKTRKRRGNVRVQHLMAALNFRKIKKILVYWKNLRVDRKIKVLGKQIGMFYYKSRVKLHFLHSLKVPKDVKSFELGSSSILSALKKPLAEWYQLERVKNKNFRDYFIFFSDTSQVNSYYLSITKSLGSYKGLLESTKKPLYVTSELPPRPATENLQKLKPKAMPNKVIQPLNMFTLSFANFKVSENVQNLVPDGFILGFQVPCNKLALFEGIKNVLTYYRTLKTLPLTHHFKKSVEMAKDAKGNSEKKAQLQYQFRVLSLFYQKWKKKYCRMWLGRMLEQVRSLKIVKKYFTASKAWKKYFGGQDDPTVIKLKVLRADNFYKNQQKIKSFFVWYENIAKVRAVKKIESFVKKFVVMNFFYNWKHLSMCFEIVNDFEVDWKKFDEFREHPKDRKEKTVRFSEESHHKPNQTTTKSAQSSLKVQVNPPKPQEKPRKPEKPSKKPSKKPDKNFENPENETTTKMPHSINPQILHSDQKLQEKLQLAASYHSVLLKKKTMCGFIVIHN